MTRRQRVGAAAVLFGLLLAGLARVTVPSAPPLYDGVVVNEPYRWLQPPPGALGGAQGTSGTVGLENGKNAFVAFATPENPPQAQIFAAPGDLTLPPGTTSLLASITPIPSEGSPTDGHIAGNVYRVSVTNQAGVPVTAPPEAYVSLVMRGPDDVLEATIARFSNGAWQPVQTSHAGYTSGFLSIVREFGDFTLVAPGGTASGSPSASPATGVPTTSASPTPVVVPPGGGGTTPLLPILLGAGAVVLLVAAAAIYRASTRRRPPPRRGGRRRR